jgi:predicted aspartyl protease
MLALFCTAYQLKRALVFFAGLLFMCNSVNAQFFEFPPGRNREVIPFKLVKNLMIIPLKINGKGPYNFVLDTGVGLFLITDPALMDTIQMQNLRSIKVTGFGKGGDLSAFVAPSLEVEVGFAKAKSVAAAILKKDVFELSNFAGMPVHGLIGFEFFNSFTVRISYPLNSITIYRPDKLYIPRKGTKIPITIEERKPYMVAEITLSSGEKIPAKLIIDTGAGHPISLESFNGDPFELPQVNIAANLGVGLTGAIKGYVGRIPSIKIGKYALNNVIAAFPDYTDVGSKVRSVTRNGSIGNNIMRRFDVVFDYTREVMYIKPSTYLKEPFEHDMSGMELASGGSDFKRVIITRVEPFSPAENVGLNKDDEILSINFKPVAEMTMQEIDNMFRSRNDRSFILEVVPNGSKERNRVILTLQRRI